MDPVINFETFVADDKTCGVRYGKGRDWSCSSPNIVTGLSPEQATAIARELRRVYLIGRSNGAGLVRRAAEETVNKIQNSYPIE